jgi:hypothetical protein
MTTAICRASLPNRCHAASRRCHLGRRTRSGVRHALGPTEWSTYGAHRAQPVATGRKRGGSENRSNRPIGNRSQPTATVPERMVRRGSTVRVRQRASLEPCFSLEFRRNTGAPGIRPAGKVARRSSAETAPRASPVPGRSRVRCPQPLSSRRDSCKIEPGGIAGTQSAMQRYPPDLVEVTR